MKKIVFLPLILLILHLHAQVGPPVPVSQPQNFLKYIWVHDSVRAPIYFQGIADTMATRAYARGFAGGSLSGGVGVKISGNTVAIDTLNYRKMDSLYPVTDSTFILKINGKSYFYKMRGAILSFAGRTGAIVPNKADYSAYYFRLDSTYEDPDAIQTLDWGKIINSPHTLSAFGILDGVQDKGGVNTWQADILSNRPATSGYGNFFYATDDSTVYFDLGPLNGGWQVAAGGGTNKLYRFAYGLSSTTIGDSVIVRVDTTTLKTVFGGGGGGVFQLFHKFPGIAIRGTDTVDIDTAIVTRWGDTATTLATRNYVGTRGYLTAESDPIALGKNVTLNVVANGGISRTGLATQTVGGAPLWSIQVDSAIFATLRALKDTAAAIRASGGGSGLGAIFNKYGTIISGGDSITVDTTKFTRFSDTTLTLATKNYTNTRGFLTTEVDPVAIAKTISDSAAYGISIAGLKTQTLNNNPFWTFKVDTTVIAPLHRIADTAAVLRQLITGGGQTLTLAFGLTGTSYNGSGAVTSKVDTTVILPLHRLADTSAVLRTLIATKANADSAVWEPKYRTDTMRVNLYAALGGKQASGNYALADSTVWYTKYRSDTSRVNIYAALAGKQVSGNYALADSTRWQTKFRTDTMRTNIYAALAAAGGTPLTMGTFDGQSSNAAGAVITGNQLFNQSATASNPGQVNTANQSFAGIKYYNSGMAASYTGDTMFIGNHFLGTTQNSADNVLDFYGKGTKFWSFKGPDTTYNGALVIWPKGSGSTDSSAFLLTSRSVDNLNMPVITLAPVFPHKRNSLDIVPSDSTNFTDGVGSTNGNTWWDLCNRPLKYWGGVALNYVATLRGQVDLTDARLGVMAFGGAPLPKFHLTYGVSNDFFTYDGTKASWVDPGNDFNMNQNGYSLLRALNTSTLSSAGVAIGVGAAGDAFEMYYLGSGHSGSHPFGPLDVGLYTSGGTAAALNYVTSSNAIPQVWYQNTTEKMRIAVTTGNLLLNGASENSKSALQVAGSTTIADSLLLSKINAGTSSDSVLVWNATSKAVHKVAQSSIGGGSFYTNDGTITGGDRTVTLSGSDNLFFNGSSGVFVFGNLPPVIRGRNQNALALQSTAGSNGFLLERSPNNDDANVFGIYDAAASALRMSISQFGKVIIPDTLQITDGNQAAGKVLQSDASGNGNWGQVIGMGTWTPSVTAGTNVSGGSGNACTYMRIGNIVSFSGSINATISSGVTNSTVDVSIPVSSTFTSIQDANGTIGCNAALTPNPLNLIANTSSGNTLRINFSSGPATGGYIIFFSGQYLVH